MVIEMVSNDLALEHLSQGQYEIGYQTTEEERSQIGTTRTRIYILSFRSSLRITGRY